MESNNNYFLRKGRVFSAIVYHYLFTVGHIMWRVQSSMHRLVRCRLYRHCHHCHCHYQKCQCRIHFIRCMRSRRHPILYNLATCILQQVLKIFVGAMLVVVVLIVVVVVVFISYIRSSASSVPFVLQIS